MKKPNRDEILDDFIKKNIVAYGSSVENEYHKRLEHYCTYLEKQLEKNKQLPELTLNQAIEKAKPNMDKIKYVDAYLNEIK